MTSASVLAQGFGSSTELASSAVSAGLTRRSSAGKLHACYLDADYDWK
jgi:hypothetical protein